MPRLMNAAAQKVYANARRIVDEGLRHDGSLFTPGRPVWTKENFETLYEVFVEGAIEGTDLSFIEKLARQLDGAEDGAIQLMAELIYWYMLIADASTMRGDTKREFINAVLGWMQEPAAMPAEVDAALNDGLVKPGTAFNTCRFFMLHYLVTFGVRWKGLDEGERVRLLEDGWAFRELAMAIDVKASGSQRHAMLHLVHPETFEAITSVRVKKEIARQLARYVRSASADVDRKLAEIRQALTEERGAPFGWFYDEEIQPLWRPEPAPEEAAPSAKEAGELPQVWVFQANPKVYDLAVEIGDVEPGDDGWWSVSRYRDQMKTGDLALLWSSGSQAGLYGVVRLLSEPGEQPREGVMVSDVTVDYEYVSILEAPILRDALKQDPVLGQMHVIRSPQGTNFRVEEEEFRRLLQLYPELAEDLGLSVDPAADDEEPEDTFNPAGSARFTVEQAVAPLFMECDEFEGILGLLRRRKNVILQGPPGVGKTFMCKRLAYALMEEQDPSRVAMVQFHQAYSYEDFIQGYRPNEESGGFRRRDGVFLRFCQQAMGDEAGRPHVFIIDEINRGNLSKIFGELMMLIEADKRGREWAVPLQYARDGEAPFHVPGNVYLIGMMNTADRSLAMVDYALRRRFAFVDLEPRFNDRFGAYLLDRGVEARLIARIQQRMGRLNSKIAEDTVHLGRGFCVGHSYFCPAERGDHGEDWYRRVVEHEVGPLLQEYWFDDLTRAEEEVRALLDGGER